MHHLFKGLFDSDEEYERAQNFWSRLVLDVASQAGQSGEWAPWGVRRFVDGTPVPRDLLPVFQARSDRLGRSVQIIQGPPTSDEIEISALVQHLRFYREPEHVWEHTDELVLNLALSRESADVARRLFTKWMDPGTSPEYMEDVIERELE